MPDIAMCINTTCPLRNGCYRYMAVPDPDWQSYFNGAYVYEAGECLYHLDTRPEDKLREAAEEEHNG